MKHAVLFPLLAAFALTSPAHAEDWAVKAIKYKNKGAYTSYFNILFQNSVTGAIDVCEGKNTLGNGLQNGDDIIIQIDDSDNSLIGGSCGGVGFEVWGRVHIDRGLGYGPETGKESCRKDGAKFYYHPDGGTMVVQTKGTTENNNRCRINQTGGVKYPPPE